MRIIQTGTDLQQDKAFIALFDCHWNEVYQICVRMIADTAVAKDLTQNIFLSVWERKIEFADADSARQYLAKSARYQVLNYLRNQKSTIPVEENTGAENLMDTQRYNPELQFIRTEMNQEMSLRIAALAEPGRTIFLLSREQELSYREIADTLDIAVKTVEKHISRCLRILRSAVKQ